MIYWSPQVDITDNTDAREVRPNLAKVAHGQCFLKENFSWINEVILAHYLSISHTGMILQWL